MSCSDVNGTGRFNYECPGNADEICGGHTVMTLYAMADED